MRNAYALLGLTFLVVFGGAYILFERAHAPVRFEESVDTDTSHDMTLTLTSSAFAHNAAMPSAYTCDGDNVLPPLTIGGVPEGTASLVLVMDDPDIPGEIKAARGIETFDHLAAYNISPETTVIEHEADLGTLALNGRGEKGYIGPCPPSEYEPREHRYVFRLYALGEVLQFAKTPTLGELEAAAQRNAIEQTELIGRYQRH